MDGQEEMTKDPLFLAVTRPALWAGVPIEAGALIIMAGAIPLVGSGNPLYGGAAAVALYAMARLIVRHDVNAFRQNGRASCRERGCEYRSKLGGAGAIKKKKTIQESVMRNTLK